MRKVNKEVNHIINENLINKGLQVDKVKFRCTFSLKTEFFYTCDWQWSRKTYPFLTFILPPDILFIGREIKLKKIVMFCHVCPQFEDGQEP